MHVCVSRWGSEGPTDTELTTNSLFLTQMFDMEDHFAEMTNKKIPDYLKSAIIRDLLSLDERQYEDNGSFGKTMLSISRKYKTHVSKRELGIAYRELHKKNPEKYPMKEALRRVLVKKITRSESGILNVSVSLPPDKFSCKYNCYFCPNEPGMPRSYLSNEDVFTRALKVGFDTVRQVYDRLDVLEKNGHPIDKIEFRVLGGTFSCYDHHITDEFIRDLYYAANTYFEHRDRPRLSIEMEQVINTSAKAHVVGLGIETRPDEVNEREIIRYRRYGVTRVEIGVQHTDDALLRSVNRGHGVAKSRRAIKLLKDYGFKVEVHIMTGLPGATPEGDMECYRQVLQADPDLIPDYLKDYPCLDVKYTTIKQWKLSGKWEPYAERTEDARDLKRVLIYRQSITPPWVRVNRIQRDFKEGNEMNNFLGYESVSIKSNLGDIVRREAEEQGIFCQCIRCCEVRNEKFSVDEVTFRTRRFRASGGVEYFISAEVPRPNRNLLLGFIRLRVSGALKRSVIPELKGHTAMVRELHVYGTINRVGTGKTAAGAQHMGIGKKLLRLAESKAKWFHGCDKVAVISGIGVRGYYRKQGYHLEGTYMMKELWGSFRRQVIATAALALVLCVVMGYLSYHA